MIRVTAYPTVEWLHALASDRPPARPVPERAGHPGRTARRKASRPRTPASNRRAFTAHLQRVIEGMCIDDVSVRRDAWVRTPDGERMLDVVLVRGTRRIGLVLGERYARNADADDALVLVYGRFDAIFRIEYARSRQAADDVACALVRERPAWFLADARLDAERRASRDSLRALRRARPVREGASRLIGTDSLGLTRIRLSRANEWVAAFERALSGHPGHPDSH